ncbi:MAG TPA: hypothetical protein VFI48_15210 [Hyphomicrobiaceae bacterium]|nr:hypothetical protein [Hyphomicrobiaceae bacterium]
MGASGPARAGPRSQAQAPQNPTNANRALAIQRYPRIGDPVDARLHFLHDLHGELATGKRTTAEADCVMRGDLLASKAVVIIQSSTGFGGITQPNCTGNDVVISDSAAAFSTGSASSVVLVTVCSPWDFGGKLAMLKMRNLANVTARS